MRQLPSRPCSRTRVGLAEALDKGRFAGEPGIVDHRIAQQQLVVTPVVEQQQVFIVNQDLAAQPSPEPEYPVNRARQAVQIVQRQAGGIELSRWRELRPGGLNLTRSPPARPGPPPPADYPSAARREKAAVGIPRIAGQRIPGEQPQRQVELTLAQGAVDLPQLVQRVMFAGGQAAAVCLGQIQLFVGICPAGEKIRLRQQRRVEQRIVPGIAGSKAVPDPQLRLRQQAAKNLALLAPGRLAGPLRWPAATSARQSASC